MERDEVQLATFGSGNSIFDKATEKCVHTPEKIWGRRSVFRLSGKPLLVAEIFLPEIQNIEA